MPQLDFTIWLLNLSINWFIFTLLFLSFNLSENNSETSLSPNPQSPFNNTNWTWNL
uniref:ATP synthase complex subunit 8 n=1 Tax=Ophiocreas oedipus TaxID=876696 RepID=A0A8K1VK03_9ECHI|nr:ATP synthase F0 subunit 8 [Ophiocreas oedipus]